MNKQVQEKVLRLTNLNWNRLHDFQFRKNQIIRLANISVLNKVIWTRLSCFTMNSYCNLLRTLLLGLTTSTSCLVCACLLWLNAVFAVRNRISAARDTTQHVELRRLILSSVLMCFLPSATSQQNLENNHKYETCAYIACNSLHNHCTPNIKSRLEIERRKM